MPPLGRSRRPRASRAGPRNRLCETLLAAWSSVFMSVPLGSVIGRPGRRRGEPGSTSPPPTVTTSRTVLERSACKVETWAHETAGGHRRRHRRLGGGTQAATRRTRRERRRHRARGDRRHPSKRPQQRSDPFRALLHARLAEGRAVRVGRRAAEELLRRALHSGRQLAAKSSSRSTSRSWRGSKPSTSAACKTASRDSASWTAGSCGELEPHVAGLRAIHSPSTSVVDYKAVTRALAEDVALSGEIWLGTEVRSVRSRTRRARPPGDGRAPPGTTRLRLRDRLRRAAVRPAGGPLRSRRRTADRPVPRVVLPPPARGTRSGSRARLPGTRPQVPVPRDPPHQDRARRGARRAERLLGLSHGTTTASGPSHGRTCATRSPGQALPASRDRTGAPGPASSPTP